jgi:prevent-host-death family protein
MPGRFIGVEQARGQLGRLVDDVAGGAEPVSLTKRGRPVAVLVNRDDWEALQQLVRAEARQEPYWTPPWTANTSSSRAQLCSMNCAAC